MCKCVVCVVFFPPQTGIAKQGTSTPLAPVVKKVDLETPYGRNVEIFLRYWVIFEKMEFRDWGNIFWTHE